MRAVRDFKGHVGVSLALRGWREKWKSTGQQGTKGWLREREPLWEMLEARLGEWGGAA